jgi:hypothetical protein
MRLADLFAKYGTDKLQHGYADVYETLFAHCRFDITAVLEVGVGTLIPDAHSSMLGFGGDGYKPGASLRAWHEYFPNAFIWGVDPQPDTKIDEGAIYTFQVDSTDTEVMGCIFKGIEFDIIIDDGSHSPENQVATLCNLWPFLEINGTYVIEDILTTAFAEDSSLLRDIVGDNPLFFVGAPTFPCCVITKLL